MGSIKSTEAEDSNTLVVKIGRSRSFFQPIRNKSVYFDAQNIQVFKPEDKAKKLAEMKEK